jgi:tetratricopeptide (TPR) repeat protein
VAAAILVPAVWLLVAKWLGTPAIVTGDSGGLLATIGGVMGAIFTVGGLVIALVAILTQLSVEARVKQAVTDARSELEQRFQRARREMERKYEHELRPELINRAKRQVQAQIAYFQATATDISDWRTAEQLTRQALDNDPDLENARSFLALQLSRYVIDGFWAQHTRRPDLDIGLWTSQTFSARFDPSVPYVGGRPFLPTVVNVPNTPPTELPVLEAITWLRDSLDHRENVGGRVAADLALMYAILGRHDKMIEAIAQARALNPEQLKYLALPYQLWILASACGTSESRLQQLGTALDISLPATHDDIAASVEQYEPNPASNAIVAWYVVPRPPVHEQPKAVAFPAKLYLFIYINDDGARKITARYFGPAGPGAYSPEDIPPQDESGLVAQAIDNLVNGLLQRFLFVCETTP